MDEESEIRGMIAAHAKVGQQIRIKLKRMISKLPIPDVMIERYILNYIGTQPFPFNKPIYLKKHKKIIVIAPI